MLVWVCVWVCLIKNTKIYLKNAVQCVCMRANYVQTLLEQVKICVPHTSHTAWKTRKLMRESENLGRFVCRVTLVGIGTRSAPHAAGKSKRGDRGNIITLQRCHESVSTGENACAQPCTCDQNAGKWENYVYLLSHSKMHAYCLYICGGVFSYINSIHTLTHTHK